VRLDADRVTLREFCSDDIAELEAYHRDPRYFEFYEPEVSERTSAKTLLALFIRTAQAKPRYDYSLAIVEGVSSQLIGCCSLRTAGQASGGAEFGMEVRPDFWGRGLAAEAAREMIRFGFDALRLDEIRGISVTANHRVERLVTALGFVNLGEHEGAPWMAARGWTNTTWGLTKSKWTQ
jgi:[ribosomal protein S5]-alanine N-acetyltransferase